NSSSNMAQDCAASKRFVAGELFMRKMTKLVVIVILSALTMTIAFAAQPEQSANSRAISGMMQMPMVAPLFLENQEFSSTLYMVNELNIPATAKVTLFDLNGTKIAEKNV